MAQATAPQISFGGEVAAQSVKVLRLPPEASGEPDYDPDPPPPEAEEVMEEEHLPAPR